MIVKFKKNLQNKSDKNKKYKNIKQYTNKTWQK